MIRPLLLALSFVSGVVHAQAEHSLDLLQQAGQHRAQGREETRILPRYLLQDPQGRAVSHEDFRGRFQLIAFGYTYCPDICPTTLVEMAEILRLLGEAASRLQPIFITVDPERDDGAVLRTYTEFFDPRILGLTGSPSLVRRAAEHFQIRYARVPGSDGHYAMDHTAGMTLLGPEGQVVKKYPYGTAPATIVAELQALLPRTTRPR